MDTNGTGPPKFTAAQTRAITALLSSGSIAEAARIANVSYNTLYRWLQQPEFQQAIQAAESELLDAAVRQLIGLQGRALQVLADLLNSPGTTDAIRLRAASTVADLMIRLVELRRFDERLNALERAAAEARMIDG